MKNISKLIVSIASVLYTVNHEYHDTTLFL